MKVSAWLVIEMHRKYDWRDPTPKIVSVRQSQPLDKLAVKVTLDIPEAVLAPQVEALVEAGELVLELSDEDEGAE